MNGMESKEIKSVGKRIPTSGGWNQSTRYAVVKETMWERAQEQENFKQAFLETDDKLIIHTVKHMRW